MAKKASLIAAIKEMPDVVYVRKKTWMMLLAERDGELHGELVAIVDKYLAGDRELRRKMPHERAMSEWLSGVLTEKGHAVCPQTVRDYFRKRRSELDGKS
jgi:hypothetical protein